MSAPLFSILLPTRQRADYLRGTLASVFAQTYPNLQVVVRDNASGDHTRQVVESFASPRLIYDRSPALVPMVKNFGGCVPLATGKYCFFLSDDDLIAPDFVERCVNLLEADPKLAGVYGATTLIDGQGKEVRRTLTGNMRIQGLGQLIRTWADNQLPLITTVAAVARTESVRQLGGLPELGDGVNDGHNADNALMIGLALRGDLQFTDQAVFYYRKHGESSERSFTTRRRVEGDRHLLEWTGRQVADAKSSAMSAEWRAAKPRLQQAMSHWYYHRLVQYHLGVESAARLLYAAAVQPLGVYGVKNCYGITRRLISELARHRTTPTSA
ncbi:MAG TPA: glycosyltransferase family A protein [Verrucomicrobiae bacterium]|nr:glycosyltransferase family A protein [Verrucomicrobiae bacterium]